MSTNKYITDTRFSHTFNMNQQIKLLVSYLIENRTVIASKEDMVSIFSTKAMISSPITLLFEKCISSGFIDEFATILKLPDKTRIPDILTLNSVIIDLKQSEYGQPLKPYQELYQKIIMNISNLIRITNTGYHVSAVQEMHSLYVKGMLSRSYSVSDLWLPVSMNQFLIKVYGMLIATVIARNTGLNYNELLNVAMIFSLYMCQMLYKTQTKFEAIPPIFYNQTYLGQRSDLINFTDTYYDDIKDGLNLDKCCVLIQKTGPARLSSYNTGLLFRQCTSLGSYIDTMSTMIALEYPPYWIWLMLQSVSGFKMGSFSKILQQHNLLKQTQKFADELVYTQSIYDNR